MARRGERSKNLPANLYRFYCIKRTVPTSELPNREIEIGRLDTDLCDNSISTAKYNLVNFLPKNLLYQFSKLANVYFLVVGLLQIIPDISTSDGIPYIFLPLVAILLVSAFKDLAEDFKRHLSDRSENNKPTHIFRNGKFEKDKWKNVRVGDVLMVQENEYFPADMVLLYSDGLKGACYIETKNLDGETNLKHKSAKREVSKLFSSATNISTEIPKSRVLKYEKPNSYLYQFNGNVKVEDEEVALSEGNFCLRGCSLRNTKVVYGAVAYTGHDTKIMLNSVKARPKLSTLEKIMNKQIIYVFAVQLLFCAFSAIWAASWYAVKQEELNFLEIDTTGTKDHSFVYNLFVRFGNWLLIFTNFVPISLLVTLEGVKLFQGMLLAGDKELIATNNSNIKPNVQSSNLLEELGQVEYVFSDKTGTLTQNFMEFKNFCVKAQAYGENRSLKDADKRPKVTNVDFLDERLDNDINNPSSPNHKDVQEAMAHVALCHSVLAEEKQGQTVYNASSPDELALLNFAKFMGFEFKGTDQNDVMSFSHAGNSHEYELLHTLEFTSKRQRMSVMLRDLKTKKLILYCKGADSKLKTLMKREEIESDAWRATEQNLGEYGKIGLRTLVLGRRFIDESIFENWNARYKEQLGSRDEDKNTKIAALQDEIEKEMELVGATAIEDKLQVDVGITISKLKEAGIRVWVLTGDKIETAINIAYSCKLLNDGLEQLCITGEPEPSKTAQPQKKTTVGVLKEDVERELNHYIEKVRDQRIETSNLALIISGDALFKIQEDKTLPAKLITIANVCKAVIACRVSPAQKQEIVEFVRKENKKVVTLAIGDGANDVNMITAAHVGIGIRGVEGQQAARASDFAVGEFRFLHRLLFVYGRESYRKNSYLILYNFFKNMVLVLPQFWYAFLNGFSGQVIFEQFIFQFFNIFFAAAPIIIYAIFDREVEYKELMKKADYYVQGPKNLLFNTKMFWFWFFSGCFQAVVVVYFSYYSLSENFSHTNGGAQGFWAVGMMAFSAVVIVTNIKIALFSNTFYFLNIFGIVGSILFYFFFFWIFSLSESLDIHEDFARLLGSGNFYFGMIIIVVLTNGLDTAITRLQNFQKEQEYQRIRDKSANNEELKALKAPSNKFDIENSSNEGGPPLARKYTGFAFSGGEEKDANLKNYKMGNSSSNV